MASLRSVSLAAVRLSIVWIACSVGRPRVAKASAPRAEAIVSAQLRWPDLLQSLSLAQTSPSTAQLITLGSVGLGLRIDDANAWQNIGIDVTHPILANLLFFPAKKSEPVSNPWAVHVRLAVSQNKIFSDFVASRWWLGRPQSAGSGWQSASLRGLPEAHLLYSVRSEVAEFIVLFADKKSLRKLAVETVQKLEDGSGLATGADASSIFVPAQALARGLANLASQNLSCRGLAKLSAGQVDNVSLFFTVQAKQIVAEVVWTDLTKQPDVSWHKRMFAPFQAAHRIVLQRTSQLSGQLSGVLAFRDLVSFSQLPLDGFMNEGWDNVSQSIRRCTEAASQLVKLVWFPEMAALWLREIVLLGDDARAITQGLRWVWFAIVDKKGDWRDSKAAAALGFATEANASVKNLVETIFGDQKRSVGKLEVWGKGPVYPFRWQTLDSLVNVGLTIGLPFSAVAGVSPMTGKKTQSTSEQELVGELDTKAAGLADILELSPPSKNAVTAWFSTIHGVLRSTEGALRLQLKFQRK